MRFLSLNQQRQSSEGVQWRSAHPEVRVGTGDLGDGNLKRGPGAEPRRGSGGVAPISQIYKDSLQLSNAFLCRFVAESVLHLPLPLTP